MVAGEFCSPTILTLTRSGEKGKTEKWKGQSDNKGEKDNIVTNVKGQYYNKDEKGNLMTKRSNKGQRTVLKWEKCSIEKSNGNHV